MDGASLEICFKHPRKSLGFHNQDSLSIAELLTSDLEGCYIDSGEIYSIEVLEHFIVTARAFFERKTKINKQV